MTTVNTGLVKIILNVTISNMSLMLQLQES